MRLGQYWSSLLLCSVALDCPKERSDIIEGTALDDEVKYLLKHGYEWAENGLSLSKKRRQEMSEDLLHLVNEELLPTLAPFGFQVVESHAAESFDNAYVVLEAPALRVQVERERSIVVLGVGPTFEPNTWFDSAVLMDYLGLSPDGGFHNQDARAVLRGARAFLTSMWDELTTMFGRQQILTTNQKLSALREQRAATRYGY